MENPVIVIFGPTGCGKSSLAIDLAEALNSPIISADSRKVFKYLTIGTNKAKLLKAKNDGLNIFGIDLIEPNEKYSVYKFLKYTRSIINKTHKQGKIPIVVGGTVLYITALVNNYDLRKTSPNIKLREELENQSLQYIQGVLKKKALSTWNLLNESERNNKRRLIRWIEIVSSNVKKPQIAQTNYNFIKIPLIPPLEMIKEKIDRRVTEMIDLGIIDETKFIIDNFGSDSPAMKVMGYQDCEQFLNKNITLQELKDKLSRIHYKYARYQIRWIKKFIKD